MVYRGKILIFQRSVDLCDDQAKKPETMKLFFGVFGVPFTCSSEANPLFCYDNKKIVKLSDSAKRLFRVFPVNGNDAFIKIIIKHSHGESCFETGIEVVKE